MPWKCSMSDFRNPYARWPTAEIMRCARLVDDTGLIPFVDTEAAARHLALSAHSLECYRSLGGGPPFYKFGKLVRYAVEDLHSWAGRSSGGMIAVPARMLASTDAGSSCRLATIRLYPAK